MNEQSFVYRQKRVKKFFTIEYKTIQNNFSWELVSGPGCQRQRESGLLSSMYRYATPFWRHFHVVFDVHVPKLNPSSFVLEETVAMHVNRLVIKIFFCCLLYSYCFFFV